MNGKNNKKTALITGASSAIGNELARLFAQDSCNLILIANNKERLNKIAEELEEKYHIFVKVLLKDLSSNSAPEEIFNEVKNENLHVNILVNSDTGVYGNFSEADINDKLEKFQVNIMLLTHLTKLFTKEMINNGGGKILNVASADSSRSNRDYMLHFSEAIANELKDKRITITTLYPGAIETNLEQNGSVGKTKAINDNYMLKVEAAAKAGYDGLKNGKTLVIPGTRNKIVTFGIRFIPDRIITKIARLIKKRKEIN